MNSRRPRRLPSGLAVLALASVMFVTGVIAGRQRSDAAHRARAFPVVYVYGQHPDQFLACVERGGEYRLANPSGQLSDIDSCTLWVSRVAVR